MNYLSSVFTSALSPTKGFLTSGPEEVSPQQPDSSFSEPPRKQPKQDGKEEISIRQPERRKKSPSIKTRSEYRLAHPPPRSKRQQRLRIRPKVLLQLQQVSDASHARPFIDVVQSVFHVSHLPARVQHNVKAAHELGADDLAIVYNEAYNGARVQDEHLGGKSVRKEGAIPTAVATVRRSRSRQGEAVSVSIHMYDGDSWVVSRLANGTYELTSERGEGEKMLARWVPKRKTVGRQRAGSNGSTEQPPNSGVFTFSIIDPNARRHPILANLSPSHIDISDQVSKPPPLSPSYSSQSYLDSPNPDQTNKIEEEDYKQPIPISCSLKLFIAVSGIWVALNEGFSPNFDASYTETESFDRSTATTSKLSDYSVDLQSDLDKTQVLQQELANETLRSQNPSRRVTSIASMPITESTNHSKASHRRSLSIRTAFTQRDAGGKRATFDARSPRPLQSLDGLDLAETNGGLNRSRRTSDQLQDKGVREVYSPEDSVTPQSLTREKIEKKRRWGGFGKKRR